MVVGGEVEQGVRLPVQRAVHELARLEVGVPRGDDLTDAPRAHHLADRHGRDVRAHVVEPTALGGLERQPQRAHEHLPTCGRGDGLFDELETVVGHDAGRAGTKHELLVHVVAHLDHLEITCRGREAQATVSLHAYIMMIVPSHRQRHKSS